MNSTTKRLLRAVEVLAWGVFFAFALLVLALRYWVLPDIERYRGEIVAAVSRGVGLPVQIGRIEAGWLGLRPQITLTDVRIADAQGREALVLPSIHNVVAWRSLLHGELRLHQLAIEGARLDVRRAAAGELYVAGLKLEKTAGGSGGGLDSLLGHSEIVIRNAEIEWIDELRKAPPLVLSGVELRVAGAGTSVALGLSARTPPELGSTVELRALIDLARSQPTALSGRLYLELGQTDLAAWRPWVDYPVNLRQGYGALRVWTTLEAGAAKLATADVALTDVWMSLADELSPLELASLEGRISLRSLPDGMEFAARGLELVMQQGPRMPKNDFRIVYRPQAGGVVEAGAVDLEALRHLVDALPLPVQIAGHLDELAPRGRLTDLRGEWSGPFDAPASFAVRARFTDLALRARGEVPGFAGLTGSLDMTQDKGKLQLASRKSEIDLPGVFPEPRLAFESLVGELEFERDAARGLTLRVPSLNFATAHASGNLFGRYERRPGEGPGQIDLSAILARADGAALERYLPRPPLVPEKLRAWLVSAIVAGDASDVRLRLRGDLRQFPFTDPASGQFQVTAHIEKGVLDYSPGWPRIQDISGELNFEREKMEITARSGTIFGARLSNVRVSIPNLRNPARNLLVSGQAEGPSEEFLKFVAASPLREKAGEFVAGIQAAGRGRLRLNFDMPLADPATTKVAADYDFAANRITLVSWLPPIEQAAGRFSVSDQGFTLHEASGRMLGGALRVAGGTRPGRGLELAARGEASVEQARTLYDHPFARQLSGRFAYTVGVRAQDGLARVSFESPLVGVGSTLPAPLAKNPGEALPLRVDVIPSAGGERDRISAVLGGLARAEVARRRQGEEMAVQRTALWLSPQRDQPIRLPERPGTLVYGSLPAFDADRWLALFPAAGEKPAQGQSVSTDLRFGVLDVFGKRFSNVALRASVEPHGWNTSVSADELAGSIQYAAAKEAKIVARLEHLSIPDDIPGATKPPPSPGRPTDLPAIDLEAQEFILRGKQLGKLKLVAQRRGGDWVVSDASMESADAVLKGSGAWRAAPSRTEMQFDVRAADVGAFLARVGNPGLVRGGKASVQGKLAWQGDPGEVDFKTLGGDVKLLAENGQFLEIEPGIGKLVGLMSLQALPRRITLDFRDVFSKGFQFDRITAAARVEGGLIKLDDKLRMRGSSAEVEMSGEASIARETQDLRVRVIPSLADSASIGIAIVNPVAGVAAALVQHMLKNPLGQFFAFDYVVSGSWTDPKVAKVLPPPPPEHVSN